VRVEGGEDRLHADAGRDRAARCSAVSRATWAIATSVSARAPARFSRQASPPSTAPVRPVTSATSAINAVENAGRRKRDATLHV
jgi:hypothetical protein